MAVIEFDGTVAANSGTLANVTAGAPVTTVYRYPIPRGTSRIMVQAGPGHRYSFDKRVWRGIEVFTHGKVENVLELDVPPGAQYVWHTQNFAVDFLFDGATLITRPGDPSTGAGGAGEWKEGESGTASVPAYDAAMLANIEVPAEARRLHLEIVNTGSGEVEINLEAFHGSASPGAAVIATLTLAPGMTGTFHLENGAATKQTGPFAVVGFLPKQLELSGAANPDNSGINWTVWYS